MFKSVQKRVLTYGQGGAQNVTDRSLTYISVKYLTFMLTLRKSLLVNTALNLNQ